MGKLIVSINYSKIAQWLVLIEHYQKKIKEELDRACIAGGHKVIDEDIGLPQENWSEAARNDRMYE